MTVRILLVDDDENALSALKRSFKKQYDLDIASGGEQALRAMQERGPYGVVVADMAMPGMNGIEFFKRVQGVAPETIRIMLTGHPGTLTTIEAINQGQVFRFLAKPCTPEAVAMAIDAGIRQYELVTSERVLLEKTLTGSLRAMTGILSVLDPATFNGARLLAQRVGLVAERMEVADAWSLDLAAMLSPLWIVPLPPSLRAKAYTRGEFLSSEEKQTISSAVEVAARLIDPIPRLEPVAGLIRSLEGADAGAPLPLGARILRVLMEFDVLEARRHSTEVALEELRMQGRDGDVIDTLAAVLDLQSR